MSTRWFCPRCRCELAAGAAASGCNSCHALFGEGSSWGPVTNDRGEWTPRPSSSSTDSPSVAYALFQLVGRLLLGGLGWLAIAALLLFSAVPYGGGNKELFGFLWLAAIVVPAWALIPLLRALCQMRDRASSKRTLRARRAAKTDRGE